MLKPKTKLLARNMAKRYRDGLTLKQVASEFGVSFVYVHQLLIAIDEPRRRSRMPNPFPYRDYIRRLLSGEGSADIARTLGIRRTALSGRLARRGIRVGDVHLYRGVLAMSDEVCAILDEAMEDDGLSFPDAYEIAMEYQPQRRAA